MRPNQGDPQVSGHTSGNLVYGIGIPASDDSQAALVALAGQFMSRVQTLSSPAP